MFSFQISHKLYDLYIQYILGPYNRLAILLSLFTVLNQQPLDGAPSASVSFPQINSYLSFLYPEQSIVKHKWNTNTETDWQETKR